MKLNNLGDIQKQITEALKNYDKLMLVQSHLEELKTRHAEASSDLKEYEQILDKELDDIQKLESVGVKSLFYKVLGSKEEQLEKERQDFLEVSLKYKELKKSVELQRYEIELLEKKIYNIPIALKEIERLKTLRETEILSSQNTETSQKLRAILSKYDLCIVLNNNIKEAIENGEKSEKILKVVLSYLKKAREWGNWDMRGSRRGDYNKNMAIDKAMSHLTSAQHQLDLFANELKDIGKSEFRFKINLSQFNKFTDFFFDNLISDWIVQQKIKSTISNVESTLDQIHRIMLSLKKESMACDNKIQELDKERDAILIS